MSSGLSLAVQSVMVSPGSCALQGVCRPACAAVSGGLSAPAATAGRRWVEETLPGAPVTSKPKSDANMDGAEADSGKRGEPETDGRIH